MFDYKELSDEYKSIAEFLFKEFNDAWGDPADSICKCTTKGIPHDFIGCPVA